MREAGLIAATTGVLLLAGSLVQAQEVPLPNTVAQGAELVTVHEDPGWFFEGPTWEPRAGKLYFTAFKKKDTRILRLDAPGRVTEWMTDTRGINGTYLSQEGRLLAAQAYGQHLLSLAFGREGPADVKTLAANPDWNQPNDVCQAPGGNIYFTDPQFGKRETSAVFLLRPSGEVVKIVTDMPTPNGVITSNDGQTLYVGDSHEVLWRSYPIRKDGTVGKGRVFFNPDTPRRDSPDGMSIDEHGNLYLTGRGGVWVASPEGKSLGRITVPEFCSNVTFGGPEGRTLYLTCQDKVYSLRMKVRGGQFAAPAE